MVTRGSGHGNDTGCADESWMLVTRPELAICCGGCCAAAGALAPAAGGLVGVAATAAGDGAGDGDATGEAAAPGEAGTGVAVLIFTRTTPEGGGAGVIDRTTETGVTTVPIGAGVDVGLSATPGGGLGAHPALRLTMASTSATAALKPRR